jgi:hypothetical protein
MLAAPRAPAAVDADVAAIAHGAEVGVEAVGASGVGAYVPALYLADRAMQELTNITSLLAALYPATAATRTRLTDAAQELSTAAALARAEVLGEAALAVRRAGAPPPPPPPRELAVPRTTWIAGIEKPISTYALRRSLWLEGAMVSVDGGATLRRTQPLEMIRDGAASRWPLDPDPKTKVFVSEIAKVMDAIDRDAAALVDSEGLELDDALVRTMNAFEEMGGMKATLAYARRKYPSIKHARKKQKQEADADEVQ